MLAQFGVLNTVILVTYLAGMVAIGWRLAGRQKTGEDYFLAGRNMPWLVVGMSMFASLTSATTYLVVPAFAFQYNIAMLFGVAMSLLVAPVLATFFYPIYRRQRVTTSYEFIRQRYGQGARTVVSTLFVLGRIGWLGVVIYAPAKAMSIAAGMPVSWAIVLIGVLAVTYTVLGGLSAVIWTDVVQFVILVGGAAWLAMSLIAYVPGGLTEIARVAGEHDRFDVFTWQGFGHLSALSAMIGWFFVFLNDYGTDQVTVQRLMAVRRDIGVGKAITFNAFNDLLINGLLIFIGIGMFAYFQAYPDRLGEGVAGDGILPYYIMHVLPTGISGLLVTAIFAAAMSSVDSGINSVSTVIVNDWIKPWRGESQTSHQDVTQARWLTVLLGVVATLAAFYAAETANIFESWSEIIGLFGAPILAIFVLGMFTRRAHFVGWLVGALAAIAVTLFLQHRCDNTQLIPIWHFPIAFVIATAVGYTASRFIPKTASLKI